MFFVVYVLPMLFFMLDIMLSAIIVYFLSDFKYKKTVVIFFMLTPCIVWLMTMLWTLSMVEDLWGQNISLMGSMGLMGFLWMFLFLFWISKLFFTLLYYMNKKMNEKNSYFFKLGSKKMFYFLKSTKYIGFLILLWAFMTLYYFMFMFWVLRTFDVPLM